MKTMETTEEVSSHRVEKRVERRTWQQIDPCAREKPRVDLKKGLQIYGAGRESRKRPTLVVGQKPYGKCQFIALLGAGLLRINLAAADPTRDTFSDTWVATDGLGHSLSKPQIQNSCFYS
jgi:hypothetical protein